MMQMMRETLQRKRRMFQNVFQPALCVRLMWWNP
jgi:hypothetical protein